MSVRLRHLGLSFAALAVAVGTIAACGGGDEDDGATGFDGVYRTQSEGLIGAIAFVANEDYMLMGPDCYTRECTEFGTFTYDEKRQVLTLTNAADGKSRQLPVTDIETERLNLNEKLSTLDLVERDSGLLADAGAKLLDGGDAGQLVEGGVGLLDGGDAGDGGGKLVKPQPKKIVESAKVGKQKATKASSKGTSSKGSSSSSSSSGGSKDDDKSDDKKSDDDKKDDKPTTTPTATPTSTSTTPPPSPTSPVTTVKVDAGDASVTVVIGGDPTCIQTVPTAKSTLPEILAYFLRCPNGIRGTAE